MLNYFSTEARTFSLRSFANFLAIGIDRGTLRSFRQSQNILQAASNPRPISVSRSWAHLVDGRELLYLQPLLVSASFQNPHALFRLLKGTQSPPSGSYAKS